MIRRVDEAELEGALTTWQDRGYAHLPGLATPDTVATLRERADLLVQGGDPGLFFQPEGATGRYEDVAKVPGWQGPDAWYRKVEKLERDPVFAAWIRNDLLRRITLRLWGGATLYRAVLFTKAPRFGSDTPWHQDAGQLWGLDRDPCLQLWLALDDAPSEAGGLEVVPASHREGLASPLGGVVPEAQLPRIATIDLVDARAGDAVLLHNLAWHRTGPNTTGVQRRAVTVCLLDPATRCVRRRGAPRTFERIFGA